MNSKKIDVLNGARFISRRLGNVEVYNDSQHKIIKTPVEGGEMELVLERQDDGGYRRQMLITHIGGVRQVLEYGSLSKGLPS